FRGFEFYLDANAAYSETIGHGQQPFGLDVVTAPRAVAISAVVELDKKRENEIFRIAAAGRSNEALRPLAGNKIRTGGIGTHGPTTGSTGNAERLIVITFPRAPRGWLRR